MNTNDPRQTIAERLKSARQHLNLKSKEFAAIAGIDPRNYSTVENGSRNVGDSVINRICNAHGINPVWLKTGDGEMFGTLPAIRTDKFTVAKLPLSAHAGSLSDFSRSVTFDECERVVSPIGNVDFAIQISGESMSPEYPNGAQILIKRIDERAFIEWGRVYVLDTRNGVVVKKIMPADDGETVKCVSINPDFPPFEVAFADIFGMYRVLMCMSLK